MTCGIDTMIAERRLGVEPFLNTDFSMLGTMNKAQASPSSFTGYQTIIENTKTPREGKTMLGNVKGYIEKHKDVIFTLALVILVDHFLFRGALRERIKGTIEGVLKKAENLIDKSGDK